ncbi:hypothetical protein [Janibacter sp. HTCC2649]|uniref:hypothetical protein n=1 Tax=Janibacter sp. HTCC2649 TaxID=313589 RepID=UPI001ED8DBA6|nr:hypothetical protein [Janibacter sp. HTCC2649]
MPAAFGFAVSVPGSGLTAGVRGWDVTAQERTGVVVASQVAVGVRGAGLVEPFTADERRPTLPKPAHFDEVLGRTRRCRGLP